MQDVLLNPEHLAPLTVHYIIFKYTRQRRLHDNLLSRMKLRDKALQHFRKTRKPAQNVEKLST